MIWPTLTNKLVRQGVKN